MATTALNRRIGRPALYREHFGDCSDADARERVGALFGLSAAAAEERDRRKAAEAEPARLKGDE